jgi:hypothetical protein
LAGVVEVNRFGGLELAFEGLVEGFLNLTGIVIHRLRSGFPLHRKFVLDLRMASILGIVWSGITVV